MASLEGGSIPHELIADAAASNLLSQTQQASSQEFMKSPTGASSTSDSPDGVHHMVAENSDAQERLNTFWQRQTEEIQRMSSNEFKTQDLPLARIKKIMKMDEDVKMISAEAPLLFSKAAQIFITELSLRAWIHTEESKRRTLQRNDIATAITKFDQFDFLIDIVPREDLKPVKKTVTPGGSGDGQQFFYTLPQQGNANTTAPNNPSTTNTSQTSVPASALQSGQLLLAQQNQNGQPLTLTPVNMEGNQILQLAQGQSNQQPQASTLLLNAASSNGSSPLVQRQQQVIVQNAQANEQKQQALQAVLQQLVNNSGNTSAGELQTIQINSQGQLQIVKVANPQGGQAQNSSDPATTRQSMSGNNQLFDLASNMGTNSRQATTDINTLYVNAQE